jgi:hypothetical protein
MGVSPVVAQMREEKSPVPVLMWAGKSPVVAKNSDRGEGCGWAEAHAQMRMRISAAQSNAVVSGQRARRHHETSARCVLSPCCRRRGQERVAAAG